MKAGDPDSSHDIVDRTEERDTIRRRLIYELDCGKCPSRDCSPVLNVSTCIRCYERFRSRLSTLPPRSP